MNKNKAKTHSGQSVIEIIVAIAIFTMIAASSVVTIIGSFSTSRLAKEETNAYYIAIEGIEAVESLRNQSWDNLSVGSYGLSNLSGDWVFSGNSDSTGKYQRVIDINQIERDGNGDIVSSGGTIDPDTYEITSTVTWDFTTIRNNSITLSTYLTNWQTATGGQASQSATPSPTDTPVIYSSCTEYCQGNSYSSGSCEKNAGACNSSGYTYLGAGDQYCTGGPNADTCCCIP